MDWHKNLQAKKDFIENNLNAFNIVNELRNHTEYRSASNHRNRGLLGIHGNQPIVKELGMKARKQLGYSKTSSNRDIVILLYNIYLQVKNEKNE